jgi:hypothetical protein
MPPGVQGLADFAIILQDIARVDINSPTLQWIRPAPSDFSFPTVAYREPCSTAPFARNGAAVIAEVSLDRCGTLVSDTPYYRWRVENVGSDSNLRSQINAAAAGLH